MGDGERISINRKFLDPRDYRKNAGKVVEFYLQSIGRSITAWVVTRDSPAKKQGKEIMFQVCSDRCRDELSAAMKEDMKMSG
jgi:hypothetical protein